MTRYPDLFAKLAVPFAPSQVKVHPGNKQHYITARTAMNRLDDVLGPENWWDDYEELKRGIKCRITIRLPDGSTVTKVGTGGYAEARGASGRGLSQEDSDKSGESDAFKRAAVKLGVGRHLYQDGLPVYVNRKLAEWAERRRADEAEASKDEQG